MFFNIKLYTLEVKTDNFNRIHRLSSENMYVFFPKYLNVFRRTRTCFLYTPGGYIFITGIAVRHGKSEWIHFRIHCVLNFNSHICKEMDVGERFIVQKLRKGDQDAYRYLYDHHYVVLCQFANELMGDSFLAETIVSDTIFHLWEIRESLDINISLRSYLMRAVRNRCYNYKSLVREKKEIRLSGIETDSLNFEEIAQTDEHPLGILLEQELEKEIIKSIDSLSDECKRVFRKSRFDYKKNEEIATELGISVNTVKYHIKTALSRLHQDLKKYLLCFISLIFLNS